MYYNVRGTRPAPAAAGEYEGAAWPASRGGFGGCRPQLRGIESRNHTERSNRGEKQGKETEKQESGVEVLRPRGIGKGRRRNSTSERGQRLAGVKNKVQRI